MSFHIELSVFKPDDLPEQFRTLLEKAQMQAETSYAPYSNFYVGAALLMKSGRIIAGSNQENGAYPSGLCAERVALFAAGAQYKGEIIDTIAVAATRNHSVFLDCAPCGACRQVMVESEQRQGSPIKIIFQTNGGELYLFDSVKDLLPFGFML